MMEITQDTSDGYHTFKELYEHRNTLWIALCLNAKSSCYWVKDHYPDWDLLLMETPVGQISYHIKSDLRDLYASNIRQLEPHDHRFDGHTSEDVLHRLAFVAKCTGEA